STWGRVQPPFPYMLVNVAAVTPDTWIVLLRDDTGSGLAVALRQTDDGGATWSMVTLPPGAEAVRCATALLGYAGASGSSCPTLSQLWRTADGGTTWSPVPGTCGPDYVDIDVVRPGLLVTAQTYGYEAGPSNLVRLSEDGGSTWRILHA